MAQSTAPPPRKKVPCDPTAFADHTNIDRRTCRRVVPMKVLALGLSRTGTASLRQALIDLGYSDCYHYSSIMNENPRDAEMWNEALQAKFDGKGKQFARADWDQLLGHCMAVTDTPCAIFYRELIEAYPDAQVVLTIRDTPAQWWTSQMRTLIPFFDIFCLPPATWSRWLWRQFLPAPTAVDKLNESLPRYYEMYRLLCDDYQNGTTEAVKWYEDYVNEIQRIVPKERLLVFNVKAGWTPLCAFLSKDVPGWEFPRTNDIGQWNRNSRQMYRMIDRVVYANAAKTLAPVAMAIGAVVVWYAVR